MRKLVKSLILKLVSAVFHDASPKIVFYHDIGKVYTAMGTEEKLFWGHMEVLRAGDVVCFDDGFRGVWEAREKLKRVSSNFKVVICIAVDLVGQRGYLTWAEIRELQENFGIEFQCHTWSHQTLIGPYNSEVAKPEDGRTEEWYYHELVDSKRELEARLGRKVNVLCFPVGYFSDRVIERCKSAGYEQVYASYPGNITDDYVQPRCLVQDLSVKDFRRALNGGLVALSSRYRMLHRVVEDR